MQFFLIFFLEKKIFSCLTLKHLHQNYVVSAEYITAPADSTSAAGTQFMWEDGIKVHRGEFSERGHRGLQSKQQRTNCHTDDKNLH